MNNQLTTCCYDTRFFTKATHPQHELTFQFTGWRFSLLLQLEHQDEQGGSGMKLTVLDTLDSAKTRYSQHEN
jgi:hypothetical protein